MSGLKTLLKTLPIFALIFAMGCSAEDSFPQTACGPVQISSNQQEDTIIPTEDTGARQYITVEEILQTVNTLMEFEPDVELHKEDAEFFDVPLYEEDNEVFYIFNRSHFEMGIVADRETGMFIQAYFRLRGRTPDSAVYMATVAGAFLAALEPERAEDMLFEAVTVPSLYDNAEMSLWDPEDFEQTMSLGEYWAFFNHGRLMNIIPIAEL